MKFLISGVLTIVVGVANIAIAGTDGHGGGGVERNGKYLTFKDVGITVTADPLTEVPQLEEFDRIVQNLPIATSFKAKLYDSYINNGDRKYFRIEDNEDYKHGADPIRNAYSSIGAVGKQYTAQDIKLFAITQGRESYLFPEYFALGSREQLAILWIEMLWAGDLVKNYNDALDSEIRFQTYIESGKAPGYDRSFYQNLARILNAPSIYVHAAAEDDLRAGRLKGFVDENGLFYFSRIFGDRLIHSGSHSHSQRYYGVLFIPHGGGKTGEKYEVEAVDSLAEQLFTTMTQHPDVEFLKALYSFRNSLGREPFKYIFAGLIDDPDLSALGVRIDLLGRVAATSVKFDKNKCVGVYQGPKTGHKNSTYAPFVWSTSPDFWPIDGDYSFCFN